MHGLPRALAYEMRQTRPAQSYMSGHRFERKGVAVVRCDMVQGRRTFSRVRFIPWRCTASTKSSSAFRSVSDRASKLSARHQSFRPGVVAFDQRLKKRVVLDGRPREVADQLDGARAEDREASGRQIDQREHFVEESPRFRTSAGPDCREEGAFLVERIQGNGAGAEASREWSLPDALPCEAPITDAPNPIGLRQDENGAYGQATVHEPAMFERHGPELEGPAQRKTGGFADGQTLLKDFCSPAPKARRLKGVKANQEPPSEIDEHRSKTPLLRVQSPNPCLKPV